MSTSDDQDIRNDPLTALPSDLAAFFSAEHTGWLRYAHQVLRHRQDAEDAVQNAGVTLHRNWNRALACANLDGIKAFAFKIVKDAVKDVQRGRMRADAKERRLLAHAHGQRPGDGQDELERLSDLDALGRAMAELAAVAPVQADVVRLRQIGLLYPEIANLLGIATTTAKTYWSLGTRHLQHLLDPRISEQRDEGNQT
ncbi:RNA polymerase sigma factor [Kitasatospora indigofera]|uniref:RNA polymerase sigma factor n=1 Tax=Kitasatospora indigofera TaxID=67307 RepID=UPI00367CBFD7